MRRSSSATIPTLRGKPVAVGHGARRGVVAAAIYEARVFGVRSAMPSVTALRKCPELIFVPPRFDVYRAVSQQIRAIFAEFTDADRAAVARRGLPRCHRQHRRLETAWQTAKAIRARILRGNRPDGLGRRVVQQVPGQARLGPAQAERPVRHHARRGRGVRRSPAGGQVPWRRAGDRREDARPRHPYRRRPQGAGPFKTCRHGFGKSGPWYYGIARGQDDRLVEPDRERKSSGSETTFDEDLPSPRASKRGCSRWRTMSGLWCEKSGRRGRTVTVKIKWADFQQSTRSQSNPRVLETREQLHIASLALIRSVFPPRKGIRLVGVTLSNLETATGPPGHADGLLSIAADPVAIITSRRSGKTSSEAADAEEWEEPRRLDR